jgi:mRNA-degrading endonuclease RelE of RelBE toxin-antitoxin system
MTTENKHIEFTKAAMTAFHSLSDREKKKAIELIELTAADIKNPLLHNKFYKLSTTTRHLYAIRLSLKLRIVIEILDTEIKVLDILNHDLFIKYFSKTI